VTHRTVSGRADDPRHFFDAYPRFVETSETGPWLDRLNARYVALIHENRARIEGARVLDLASHDGRFTFAALRAGAARVVGIEHDPRLVQAAAEHLAHYGVARDRYDFVTGDLFEYIRVSEPCDVVFVFGIFYHVNDHMRLLTELAHLDARTMIFDTNVSTKPDAVIELRAPIAGSPPPPGSQIEGWPTRAALEAMWSSFGWSYEFYDWRESEMAGQSKLDDYAGGRRLTAVVTSDYADVPAATRARAVQAVRDRQRDLPTQWFTINEVATGLGLSPQALRTWVRRSEQLASGADGVASARGDAVD
jgi:16S rRNA G966 N2-methylase RsmD